MMCQAGLAFAEQERFGVSIHFFPLLIALSLFSGSFASWEQQS